MLAATKDIKLTGIKDGGMGLIQVVADNSSQNGKSTTHCLAMLITQPTNEATNINTDETITRIRKSEMSQVIDFKIPVQHYQGPN